MRVRHLAAGTLALMVVGCAAPPTPGTGPVSTAPASATGVASSSITPPDLKACMVADASGFTDGAFNQSAHQGLLRAGAELGVQTGEIQSPSEADYAASIQSLVAAECDLITVIGFKHADAAEAAAVANPQVQFLLADAMPTTPQPNLKPLLFDPTEAAFLAGYLAASQSATGAVGAFAAVRNADVLLFLNGYAQGVAYFNQVKATQVKVLGWDMGAQDGQFISSLMPDQDVAAGKTTAQNLVAHGADVIFPVAGLAGTGALQVAQESGGQVRVIWADTDGCLSNPGFCPVILTSVFKGLDVAVFDAIRHALEGEVDNTAYHGTLANAGVGLSPFHEFDDQVGGALKAELEGVRKGLVDGTIQLAAAG